jgi:DNA polymerase (family 10)
MLNDARRAGLPLTALTELGGVRRYAPDVAAVGLLGVAPGPLHDSALDGFARLPLVTATLARSAAHVTVVTVRGPVTLHVVEPHLAGPALVWHTGSKRHTAQLQARGARLGLDFANGRLTSGEQVLGAATEDEVYRHLKLPFIAPELREGLDEIAAAEGGRLPPLLTRPQVRGDLHMHSTWSDGRNTIDEMAVAARALGYDYIAITDHSRRARASRTLAASEIARQREEIDRVQAGLDGTVVLHGVEVEILGDGSLDFEDEDLEPFDIVLASLHEHEGQSGDALTRRYLRAIEHPLVNVITHPANRTPGLSDGYDLDFDALFAAAAETGTAMEIDGSPMHLDLDGALARRAAAAGVTLVVDSDSHRADALARQMRFGLGTARRGWIEARHVLNTGGVEAVRAFVAAKRARG